MQYSRWGISVIFIILRSDAPFADPAQSWYSQLTICMSRGCQLYVTGVLFVCHGGASCMSRGCQLYVTGVLLQFWYKFCRVRACCISVDNESVGHVLQSIRTHFQGSSAPYRTRTVEKIAIYRTRTVECIAVLDRNTECIRTANAMSPQLHKVCSNQDQIKTERRLDS